MCSARVRVSEWGGRKRTRLGRTSSPLRQEEKGKRKEKERGRGGGWTGASDCGSCMNLCEATGFIQCLGWILPWA